MVMFNGIKYEVGGRCPKEVSRGQLVRFEESRTVRRVVGRDGDDVILRGVRSAGVFEAVDCRELHEKWVQLVPVG